MYIYKLYIIYVYIWKVNSVYIYIFICMSICIDIHKRSTVWLKKVSKFFAFFPIPFFYFYIFFSLPSSAGFIGLPAEIVQLWRKSPQSLFLPSLVNSTTFFIMECFSSNCGGMSGVGQGQHTHDTTADYSIYSIDLVQTTLIEWTKELVWNQSGKEKKVSG